MVSCLHCLIIIFCVRFDASNGYENLALNKSAWQPTTYGAPGWTAFAAAAVDGNRDQFAPHSSCAMQAGATTAEWNVDLGKVHDIDYIDVYFRHDSPSLWNSQYKNRIAGFQIYVSNTTERVDRGLCFTEAGSIKPIMTIQCVQRGKYVIFYNTQNFKLYNELCEVEVYACPPERFGLKCNEICSNCYTNTSTMCDHVKGKCHSGCNSGWKGDRCTEECDSHFYGPNCHLKCGNCLNNIPCHHVNGTCPSGCAAGWKGNKCFDECDDFKYGPQCSMICGNCLNNIKCHHINGTCPDECQPGWQNHNCKSIERESPVQNPYTAMKSCETVLLGAIIGWIFNAIFIVCGLILLVLFKTRKFCSVKKRPTLYEDIQMKSPNDNHIYSATKSN